MKLINFILFTFLAFCQTKLSAQTQKCGATEAQQLLLQKHPEYRRQIEVYENKLNSLDIQNLPRTRDSAVIIPVVFHVLHANGVENISDAQIYSAIEQINKDYSKQNADFVNTIPQFQSVAASVDFEFRLAQKDPEGNCTNGIDRIFTYKTFNADDEAKLNIWNPSYYLNIWVVKNFSADHAQAAAYAYKPASANIIFYYDGIITLHDYVGNTGTSNPFLAHTLSHEIGHYFNLDHTWGSTNQPGVACGDDGVFDTPQTKGHSNCNNLYDATCNLGIVENVQNFMEYSYCETMFTQGQKDRMWLALNATVADRFRLNSSLGHLFTGVLQKSDCAPKPHFKANKQFVCSGSNVNFTNLSYGDTNIVVSWTFEDGSVTSSNVSNPVLNFTGTGFKKITLTASSNAGSATKDYPNYLFVANPNAISAYNYVQDFEDIASLEAWPIFNVYGNEFSWRRSSLGFNGHSYMMKTYDNRPPIANATGTPKGDVDEFYTPAFDMTPYQGTTAYLNFNYAGSSSAAMGINMNDTLTISYSTDCGNTWKVLKKLYNVELCNNSYVGSGEFFADSYLNWGSANIALDNNLILSKNNVFFKFTYKTGEFSNNFFIDNIGFSSTVLGLPSYTTIGNLFKVVPNPAQTKAAVVFDKTYLNTEAEVEILDLLGNVLGKQTMMPTQLGQIELKGIDKLPKGNYFLKVRLNQNVQTQKFVVQ